jgi:hypothetical protein
MNRKALWLALSLSLSLGAVIATVSSVASADAPAAQARAAAAAPSVVDARFQRYLVSPRGETMGLLLDNGIVVRVHPEAFAKGAPELKAGDTVHVEGRAMKTATGQIFMHALVKRGADTIADATAMKDHDHHGGKKGDHKKGDHKKGDHDKAALAPLSATGKIVAIVSGHKGGVAGVVLDDGTTASAGHKADLAALNLKVGDQVTLTGRGGVYPRGKGLKIEQVKLPSGDSRTLASAPRRHRDHAKI